jgi:hypothetical protein
MADSEERRYLLHQKVEQSLWPDEASTLMEHLPPWWCGEVAKARDVEALKGDVAALRTDVAVLKVDLQAFAAVNQVQHEALEHTIIGHLEREMRKQTWRLVTVVVAVGALVAASGHL